MQIRTNNEIRVIINKYEHEYRDEYQLSGAKYRKLHDLFSIAELLAIEFDATSIDVQITPAQKHGFIILDFADMIIKNGRSHPFYTLIQNADFLRFAKTPKEEKLRVIFGVFDLWIPI